MYLSFQLRLSMHHEKDHSLPSLCLVTVTAFSHDHKYNVENFPFLQGEGHRKWPNSCFVFIRIISVVCKLAVTRTLMWTQLFAYDKVITSKFALI